LRTQIKESQHLHQLAVAENKNAISGGSEILPSPKSETGKAMEQRSSIT
jgi:hypothetical protein